ncbi:MAG TPA: sigma 54-interacting transcriptional regulator [Terriglobia bacterium]|nr:sigma 54-interacting transcriptional regulator [Terriglobia bacterium]
MQSGPVVYSEGPTESRRYEALLEMADLMVRHHTLPELYHEMAVGLRKVADFKFLNFSLYHPENRLMHLHFLEGEPASGFPTELPVDESPTGWSWQHQQELIFDNLEHEARFPRVLEELRSRGIRTYYVLPLTTGEKRLGGLGVASVKANAYQEQDRRFLRRVAELVALAIENASTREALQEEKDRLRALVEINRTLASRLEVQSLLPLISECVTRVVPHDFAGVTLFEGDKENMKAYVLSPERPQAIVENGRPVSLSQTLSAQAFLEGQAKTLTHNDLESHGSTIARRIVGAGIRTMRCVPLLTSTGTLGTLNVGSKKDKAFSEEDEEILNQIAAQLAIALDNARAYREIQVLKDRLAQEKLYLEDEIRSELNFEEIIGESAELKHVLAQARTVAPSDSTVLILGETGTGKELIARAIHRMSKRKDSSFIKVNCASIPTGLLESELFGHEKGAFTGAVSKKIGRMELADKGTLFLDEVGDIPLELQPKLLRVLQDHEFERLGSNRTVRVDLRLIAATNRDLSKRITEGEFRSDLFYRLNVFPIHMPPLRTRRNDIPSLVRHFVKKLSRRMDKRIDNIPSQTMEALVNWHWPGNIRELENLIERSVILSDGPVLHGALTEMQAEPSQASIADATLERAEREHIIRVLRECGGRVAGAKGAAVKLGLKRTTLQSKMGKLKIDRKDHAS